MADEPVGEVEAPVVYELAQFADTQGREVTRLCPVDHPGEPLPVRYRGQAMLISGQAKISFAFEIQASSVAEAFERFDARRDEEGEAIASEMRKKVLAAGSPKIDDFRRDRLQRQRRFGGNGG